MLYNLQSSAFSLFLTLIQPFFEAGNRTRKNDHPQDRQEKVLRPEDIEPDAFEKYAPQDHQKISQRIKIDKPLDNDRHVGNGKNETTEHEKRKNKKECCHHGLLLRRGYGGDNETNAQRAQQK